MRHGTHMRKWDIALCIWDKTRKCVVSRINTLCHICRVFVHTCVNETWHSVNETWHTHANTSSHSCKCNESHGNTLRHMTLPHMTHVRVCLIYTCVYKYMSRLHMCVQIYVSFTHVCTNICVNETYIESHDSASHDSCIETLSHMTWLM